MTVLIFWMLVQYKVNTHEPLKVWPHTYTSRQYCEADKPHFEVDGETYAICQPYAIDNENNAIEVQP